MSVRYTLMAAAGVVAAAASLIPATAGTNTVTVAGAQAVFPGKEWQMASPESQGADSAKLQQARDYALTGGGSGCIVRGGKKVLAWGDQKQRYDLKSSTKSFGAAALGLAVKDGKLRLDQPAREIHPMLGTPPEDNATTGWLDGITIRHLASQTAGFEKPGGYTRLLFKPGTQWDYSDSGPNWLAECVTLAYRRDVDELMFERLFAPIGIRRNDLVWRKNAYRPELLEGVKRREFGSGISANVEAMARFGLLFLREGEWNGKEILPRAFVDQVRTTVPGVPGLPVRKPEEYGQAAHHYGLLWWNNADGTIDGVPRDAYWSWGLYDSLIVVMPSLDIVVARAGKSWTRKKGAAPYDVLIPFLQPIAASAGTRAAQGPKLPAAALTLPSPVIAGIEWAPPTSIVRLAKCSDNWPLTWADDDYLYTAYGDGNGFEPFVKGKLSLGLAKVMGVPPELHGANLRSVTAEAKGDGARGRKASGLLCVDGVLYMLVRNVGNAQLGWSSDHGATWTWAPWRFTESFGCPTFLNFGKDYLGARDGFVYIYTPDSASAYDPADRFVLTRVPKEGLRERAAYEFYTKTDKQGRPAWSADIAHRGAILARPGACYRSCVTYDAGLKRYLWCQTQPDHRGLTVCDAPEPWGPWTVVFETPAWDVDAGESASLPSKWMSADGLTVHLVFSGDDSFAVRRATLVRRRPNHDSLGE